MGRFDRYLLSQLMTLFGFFSLVLIMVYWVNRAVALFDQLISDGQGMWVFVEFTALSLPAIIKLVLPLSAFVASVYVANRLSGESELVVVQSTGFSPARVMRAVMVFGLIAVVMVQILAHVLVPLSNQRLNIRQAEVTQTATARILRAGEFMTPIAGVTLYIRNITPEGELQDVFLSDSRASLADTIYTASRAYIVRTERAPQLVMVDGSIQNLSHQTERMSFTTFSDFAYDLSSILPSVDPAALSLRNATTLQLLLARDEMTLLFGADNIRTEIHDRLSEPLLGLIGPLLGFATLLIGGFSRFGLSRQIAAAVGLVILVKMIESTATGAIRRDAGLWWTLYLPAVFGLGITGLLLFLAARPLLSRRISALLTFWRGRPA